MSAGGYSRPRELQRIKRVYARYDHHPGYRRRHRPERQGNRLARNELLADIEGLLRDHGLATLEGRRVLDVGCGYGHTLSEMRRWGARDQDLAGVDLLPWRVQEARRAHPHIEFVCADAAALPYDDASFDLLLAFTLFSSIRDGPTAGRVAAEMDRVLAPGGAILWYDLRYPSPLNPHVERVSKRRIRRLFPRYRLDVRATTTLPPLARWAAESAPWVMSVSRRGPLRSHHLALLSSPREAVPSQEGGTPQFARSY